jgi:hypothetical protein
LPSFGYGGILGLMSIERSPDELWREIEREVADCFATIAKRGSGAS